MFVRVRFHDIFSEDFSLIKIKNWDDFFRVITKRKFKNVASIVYLKVFWTKFNRKNLTGKS